MKPCGNYEGDGEFELSTGKTLYAHRGLVSLVFDDGRWQIGHGFDGIIWRGYPNNDFTADELKEIAEYQIALWQEFIKAIPPVLNSY